MGRKYQQRVSELIHIRLSNLLERKVKDPRLDLVTITDVEVSPDAARANVYFTAPTGDRPREEVQEGLESAAGWLRRELGQQLRLRHTPELIFHYDRSVERGERISGILDELGLGDEEIDTATS
ncbi:MAG: 30S ribosome-binding factor RbfA [Anaerolineae bacterium]|nr:30S ribosome-binding factor RbfA [Anaerolineae bacterium]